MTEELILEILMCFGIVLVLIPVHELGHVLAFRYYGVASTVKFNSFPLWEIGLACVPKCPEAQDILILGNFKREVIVHLSGGLAVVIGALIYYFYPALSIGVAVLSLLAYTIFEVGYMHIKIRRELNTYMNEFWYLESNEEYRFFIEEVKEYANGDLYVPYVRALLRTEGFVLNDWK